ncbi:MAG TPA: helix-turn-helix domain-containing protein [Aridibacter sp.]|nr:helix-turn-helix domain-containing protein [Aridibacter sp.]
MDLLTVKQAAERLGKTHWAVHYLIREGLLKAEKLGHQYVIKEADLRKYLKQKRDPGRPLKAKQAD